MTSLSRCTDMIILVYQIFMRDFMRENTIVTCVLSPGLAIGLANYFRFNEVCENTAKFLTFRKLKSVKVIGGGILVVYLSKIVKNHL